MAKLFILESPTKAHTIQGYLGSGYRVIASQGHVRDLPKSTFGVDIENGFEPKYINIRGRGDLIKDIKKEAKNADIIYLATDSDREGEAISWHLAAIIGEGKNLKRVTYNEVTKSAVKEAIKNPRGIDMNLVDAQQARRILDRIVGYKLSPLLWKNVGSGLSAGRVQSVATRAIVEREAEIRAFVPVEYWTMDALLEVQSQQAAKAPGRVTAAFYGNADGRIKLTCEEDARRVRDAVAGGNMSVKSIKRGIRHRSPAPPFTTSTMQQEASRKLGFQSQRIMRVAQELYEGINIGAENGGTQGLITYMRTDSLRISTEASASAREFIERKYGGDYYPEQPRVYKTRKGAQDAHEAIRPTSPALEPQALKKHLSADQFKLYKLIWERFISSQMQSAELNTVTVDFERAGYIFRTSGYTVKFPGFMAVYEESADAAPQNPGGAKGEAGGDAGERNLKIPPLSEGEELRLIDLKEEKHFTEPPPRYTEASLIKFFEERGIARPSTYTPTITTIISRGYVRREGKSFVPTKTGEVITDIMKENFGDIVDYEFTAEIENRLDGIEGGETDMRTVLHEFYAGFKQELDQAEQKIGSDNYEIPPEETDIICEKCGSRMILKNGRYGKFAACPNYPECKNTKPVTPDGKQAAVSEAAAEPTGLTCEVCGRDMVLRKGRYGNFYACAGYPECKTTKKLAKELGVDCPDCGAKLLVKSGKNKSVFYACEKYPDCKFISWDMPTGDKCPDCGKVLYKKRGKDEVFCKECKPVKGVTV